MRSGLFLGMNPQRVLVQGSHLRMKVQPKLPSLTQTWNKKAKVPPVHGSSIRSVHSAAMNDFISKSFSGQCFGLNGLVVELLLT